MNILVHIHAVREVIRKKASTSREEVRIRGRQINPNLAIAASLSACHTG